MSSKSSPPRPTQLEKIFGKRSWRMQLGTTSTTKKAPSGKALRYRASGSERSGSNPARICSLRAAVSDITCRRDRFPNPRRMPEGLHRVAGSTPACRATGSSSVEEQNRLSKPSSPWTTNTNRWRMPVGLHPGPERRGTACASGRCLANPRRRHHEFNVGECRMGLHWLYRWFESTPGLIVRRYPSNPRRRRLMMEMKRRSR